jgi:lipopolysaccharide exporter
VSPQQQPPQPDEPKRIRRSVFRGSLLVMAARWMDRAIGFISMLILARLLTPADFGLVALAMVVIGLVGVLLDVGINIQLVRNENATRDDFDTAWTIRILQGGVAAGLILATSWLAGDYFHDRRITVIMWILAPMPIIGSLGNIGIVNFQKDLEFGKEFQYLFWRRLIGFFVTIAATLWLRSYWGLVIGSLANALGGTLLSYIVHDYRPRLSLEKARDMWGFSTWLMLRSIGAYISTQVDKVVLGRRSTPDVIGAYKLADELAGMPSSDLLAPVGRALFPAFAREQSHPTRLRDTFLLALAVSTLIVIPAGLGLSLVADVAVPSLLGNQWLAAIPLLQILALNGMINAFGHSPFYVLLAVGEFRVLTMITYAQILAFLALATIGPLAGDVSGVAVARLLATLIGTVGLMTLVLVRARQIRVSDCAAATWRPLVATLGMAAVVSWLPIGAWPAIAQLVGKAAVGAACYTVLVVLLWLAAGRPEGAERYLLDKMRLR